MPNRLILAAAALAAISFASKTADAAPQWNLSPQIGNSNGFCNGNGITTRVGYYGEVTPRTGDNPDSAVLVTITAGCGPVTVAPSFNLPAGVVQDTTQSVLCTRKRGDLSLKPNACSNTPIWPNDWNVPNMFGWSYLDAGETLTIYVPVAYTRKVTNVQFSSTVYNNFFTLYPNINFNIDYLPRFANFNAVNSYDSKRADISFKLDHFHENTQVFVDYGTSTLFGSTIYGGNTDPQWTYYQTFTMPTIYGLSSNTTYYYRVRLVTPYGTFTSSTQSFITYAQLSIPRPVCPRWPCAYP